jgi:hypothetical protein
MQSSKHPINSFRPLPEGSCVCGSGKIFKNCCGSNAKNRGIPKKIWLKKSFLPANVCDKLVDYAEKSGSTELETVNDSEGALTTFNNEERVTLRVDLGSKQAVIDGWVSNIFHKILAPKIKKKIREYTPPDLMCYQPGGHYIAHADSEIFDKDAGEWKKVLDRDYSLLLYLNDDFDGGAVYFHHFDFTYQPKKGDLLIFPANNTYLHEAREVTEGRRYVVVSWAAVS